MTPEEEVVELKACLVAIVDALANGQPSPRSASVTYVAGYARAMDDMKNVIGDAVHRYEKRRRLATPDQRRVSAAAAAKLDTRGFNAMTYEWGK